MSMESPYPRIIEILESEVASTEPKDAVRTLQSQFGTITYSIIEEVRNWINIPDLEQRLHSDRDIDTGLVRRVC